MLPLASAQSATTALHMPDPQPVLACLRITPDNAAHAREQHATKRTRTGAAAAKAGRMQDLRQLVRMLLKLMPNSEEHLPEAARRGGGNRMVRPHIEAYLENTLGEAPRPDSNASWKVYLAGLFSWVLDRPVSADEAARCLDRSPGTSWVARWPELFMLGISRDCFAELPLTKPGVQAAQKQLPKAEMQKCEMSVKTQADCQQPSLARAKLSRKHETTEPADMDNGKLYSWYNLKLAIRDTKRIEGSPGLEPSPRERKLLKAMKEEVLVEIQQLAGTGTFSI